MKDMYNILNGADTHKLLVKNPTLVFKRELKQFVVEDYAKGILSKKRNNILFQHLLVSLLYIISLKHIRTQKIHQGDP